MTIGRRAGRQLRHVTQLISSTFTVTTVTDVAINTPLIIGVDVDVAESLSPFRSRFRGV
jgi:hypothetical protein